MGFFRKIFGGGKKSDTGELETTSGEQEAIEESGSGIAESEPIPEEDRVPEPEPEPEVKTPKESKSKATVFGMPAPVTPDQVSGEVTSGEVTSGEITSGEITSGEITSGEITSGEVTSGEVTSGEVTSGEVTSGEVTSGEVTSGEIASGEIVDNPVPAAVEEPAARVDSKPMASPSGARPALPEVEEDDLDLFPKVEKKDSRSMIDCTSCSHRLPVPYVGYPARITCPFCLNVNEYNL